MTCVNFGCVNASVEAFLNEPGIMDSCRMAELTVVELTGAQNLSNRFFTVHPRRNDRFLRASTILRALYPEVDFSEFCFTRHMLTRLHALDSDRFTIVREELQTAWAARMRSFLTEIGPRTLLLWFADHLPSDAPFSMRPTRRMGDPLHHPPHGGPVAPACPRRGHGPALNPARWPGGEGLIHLPHQAAAARASSAPAAHEEAASLLTGALQAAIAA